jgi:dephospho-CoA kinase
MALNSERKFVGLTGTFASGKGTVIEVARELYGDRVASVSTSDIVREETARRGLSLERENLQRVANELRAEKGTGVLAEMALERASELPEKVKIVFVDGIRNVGEVNFLRRLGRNFVLWAVDAPLELRYERVKQRKRAKENLLSFEEFKESDARERAGMISSAQMVGACMDLADEKIVNDGSRDQLKERVAFLLKAFI